MNRLFFTKYIIGFVFGSIATLQATAEDHISVQFSDGLAKYEDSLNRVEGRGFACKTPETGFDFTNFMQDSINRELKLQKIDTYNYRINLTINKLRVNWHKIVVFRNEWVKAHLRFDLNITNKDGETVFMDTIQVWNPIAVGGRHSGVFVKCTDHTYLSRASQSVLLSFIASQKAAEAVNDYINRSL